MSAPFYRGKEIIEKHNGNDVSTELFITRERYEEIKSKFDVPKPGDILLSSVGTLGVSWLVDEDEFYFKDGNLTWLRSNERTTPEFLYLWLNSPEAQNQINTMCIGSTQKAITIETLNKFDVTLPPMELQKRICDVIYPIRNKIKTNTSINRNLLEQALTIYCDLFDGKAKNSTLDEVSANITDGVHNTVKDDPEGEYFLLSCKNIKGGSLSLGDSERRINKETFEKLRRRTKLEKGDILLSSVGTVGELLLLNTTPDVYEFQRSVAIIKPDKEIVSSEYLYCALLAQKKEIIYAAHGAVQQCLFISDIKGFTIHKPEPVQLLKFDNAVAPMMGMIYQNEKENKRLSMLRDSLLPKLMSGELDVSKLEI